jgi:glycosyltransferase involved in cell wall biosynthesis
MEQNKILTIIIPTYNMEKYLRKCLDSLLVSDENMQRLEVLVVNDGSKDSSSSIAHEYEAKYPQTFRVIDKENGNYGSCINRGLKEATGIYVKVLDADDYYVNEAFNSFISFLAQVADVDLVLNDFCTVEENDKVIDDYTFNLPTDRSFTLADIPLRMTEWLWHHGIAYRTEILRQINYRQTEGISYTDDEWIFIPMVAVRSVVYFPKIVYHYLLGREGQTFDPKVMMSSFDKRIKVGISMVKFYASVLDTCADDSKRFMTEKLKRRIMVIYNFYLTKHYTPEGNRLLKSFDQFVKNQSDYIYQLIGQDRDKFGRKNYICVWREAQYKNTVYLFLRQVKFKVRMLLGKKFRNLSMPVDLKRK